VKPHPRCPVTRRLALSPLIFPALALVLLLAVSCSRESGQTLEDVAAAKDSVDSLWTHYAQAANRHDAAAFGALFAGDAAVSFSSAPTVQGRDSVQKFLAARYTPVYTTALRIQQDEFRAGGTIAFQSGTFQQDYNQGNLALTTYGRFTLLAERGDDKQWRILRLMAVADTTR
jgi:ketosteroid isomerase-like protein